VPAFPAPQPPDERERLAALYSYRILDTAPESEFDNLTRLIAHICSVPIALISFVDEEREWFKARVGIDPMEAPRDTAFCAHTILSPEMVVEIGDTLNDARFATSPLVTGNPNIRFYAGAPLRTASGLALGTLCVIDRVPRRLETAQRQALRILADEVMARLELRRQLLEMRQTEENLRANASARQRMEDALRQSEARLEAELARRTAELRTSEDRFRLIADNSRDLIAIYDEHWRYVYLSPSHRSVLGYEIADLLERERSDLIPPEDLERLPPLDQQTTPVEFRLRKADGAFVWIEGTTYPITTEGRRLIVAVGHDITARKAADDELRAAEHFLQRVVDTIPGSVYVHDIGERRNVFMSRDISSLLGYSPEEVRDMGSAIMEKLVHPDDLQLLLDHHQRHADAPDDRSSELEFRAKHASGDTRMLRTREVPFERIGPEVRQVLGVALDVTEQRRTELLLRQAQKVEALGLLAGGVAHDFNNLLGVITGYGELAQRQLDSDHPVQRRLEQVLEAAGRAAGLTRQLLAFSRTQVMQPKVLDLNAVVGDAHRMLVRLIREDIELVIRLDPTLGRVKADPSQMEQVVLNLVVNARDAMPEGGRLTLSTANVEFDEVPTPARRAMAKGPCVRLTVSDTGIGMDAATQLRIFEPFFTTKAEGHGTGLGLATVFGIVKQSGGQVLVESQVGRGSTFSAYLPRSDDAPDAAVTEASLPPRPRGDETILLVEDTDTLRQVVREVLEAQGYAVLVASEGEEALEVARQHRGPIHLLLTDVVMPKLGGARRAARRAAARIGLRVRFIWGHTNNERSFTGARGDPATRRDKPVTSDALARAVREARARPLPG
jgi:PAS domain S-box-containing protein